MTAPLTKAEIERILTTRIRLLEAKLEKAEAALKTATEWSNPDFWNWHDWASKRIDVLEAELAALRSEWAAKYDLGGVIKERDALKRDWCGGWGVLGCHRNPKCTVHEAIDALKAELAEMKRHHVEAHPDDD